MTAPPCSLIREFSAPDSTRAPAASGVCTQTTPELSAGTRAPVQHNAMSHVPPACASCGVLRSAPGASSPQIVGFWPFAAAVRTHQRPRLAGEARPAAPRWFRWCAPAGTGARVVWEALERPARNVILLSADSGRAKDQKLPLRTRRKPMRGVAWVWNDSTHRFPPSSERQFLILSVPPMQLFLLSKHTVCLEIKKVSFWIRLGRG